MSSTRLRPADLEYVRKECDIWKQLDTGYRSWMPIETIPRALDSKFYTLEEIPGPALSISGADYMGVRTARLEDESPLVFMRYKLHWDITEVEAAQRAGVPLKADGVKVALRSINDKIAQMVLEGLDWPEVVSGASEVGTDLGAGLDTTYVGTPGQFTLHAQTIYHHMLSNGYRGPYNLIVSDTIRPFLYLPQPGGHGLNQEQYIKETFDMNVFTEKSDTAATFAANIEVGLEEVIPAMIYTADNGIWVGLAATMENMALQEVAPPQVYIDPEINRETNKYEGYVEWHGTVRFTHDTAACVMPDVDAYA